MRHVLWFVMDKLLNKWPVIITCNFSWYTISGLQELWYVLGPVESLLWIWMWLQLRTRNSSTFAQAKDRRWLSSMTDLLSTLIRYNTKNKQHLISSINAVIFFSGQAFLWWCLVESSTMSQFKFSCSHRFDHLSRRTNYWKQRLRPTRTGLRSHQVCASYTRNSWGNWKRLLNRSESSGWEKIVFYFFFTFQRVNRARLESFVSGEVYTSLSSRRSIQAKIQDVNLVFSRFLTW